MVVGIYIANANMIDKLQKLFYNWWWQKHPPEQVKYYKTQQFAKGKIILTNEGIKMQIKGEKYPFPGFPRGHILTNPYSFTNLAVLKHKIKNRIFNYAWEELEKGKMYQLEIVAECKRRLFGEIYDIMEKSKYDVFPYEKLCPMVKELWQTMTKMEELNSNIRKLKEILCFILQEDDGYRFRVQWLLNYFNPSSFWSKLFKRNNLKYFKLALTHLEQAEVLEDMKERIKLLRTILLLLLEDENIKTYFNILCYQMNWNKLKMSKADKYFSRGKWFKTDYKIYNY